jgi:mitochondrial fission protein ELM1
MKSDFEKLVIASPELSSVVYEKKPKIGVLIGGNSKNYTLTSEHADLLCQQLKKLLNDLDGYLFLTTSRRTPQEVIGILKTYFNHDARVKLFVVASEDNPLGTVGGIFYLCDVLVVSGESISMVSESVATGKYVVVFEPDVKLADNKVKRFLTFLAAKKYIYLLKIDEIYGKLSWLISSRPEHHVLNNKTEVVEGLKKIIR